MSHNIHPDIITVIITFLPLDDCLRCTRVSTSWNQAIESLQNTWKDILINFLKIEKIFGSVDKAIDEYIVENNQSIDIGDGDDREPIREIKLENGQVNWLELVKFQYSKLPKKIKSGVKEDSEEDFKIKTLDQLNYGNVELVKNWVSPFESESDGDIALESVSYYEFPFDLRRDIIERYTDEYASEKLKAVYIMCLVYELLSVGDYVPNLYNDIVRIEPILQLDGIIMNNYTLKESFASILLCILQRDCCEILKDWCTNEILGKIKPNDQIFETSDDSEEIIEPSDVSAVDVIQSIQDEGFKQVHLQPNIKLSYPQWLGLDSIKDVLEDLQLCNFSGEFNRYEYDYDCDTNTIFPLFFNAGGGVSDCFNIKFNIEQDGRIVKITRKESRTYY